MGIKLWFPTLWTTRFKFNNTPPNCNSLTQKVYKQGKRIRYVHISSCVNRNGLVSNFLSGYLIFLQRDILGENFCLCHLLLSTAQIYFNLLFYMFQQNCVYPSVVLQHILELWYLRYPENTMHRNNSKYWSVLKLCHIVLERLFIRIPQTVQSPSTNSLSTSEQDNWK